MDIDSDEMFNPRRWDYHMMLRLDVLLVVSLPDVLSAKIFSYLDDRDRSMVMWVNWNMMEWIWEHVPEFWTPHVSHFSYNPRITMKRTLYDRAWQIWWELLPKTTRRSRRLPVNEDGFRVGKMVEILWDSRSLGVGSKLERLP